MILKKYLDHIKKLAEQNPELLEATVIYASDDEGNSFHEISYSAASGNYDGQSFSTDIAPVNAVCLN